MSASYAPAARNVSLSPQPANRPRQPVAPTEQVEPAASPPQNLTRLDRFLLRWYGPVAIMAWYK